MFVFFMWMMIYMRDTSQLCCGQTPGSLKHRWSHRTHLTKVSGESILWARDSKSRSNVFTAGGSMLSPNHSSNLQCSLISTSTFATITGAIQRRPNTEPRHSGCSCGRHQEVSKVLGDFPPIPPPCGQPVSHKTDGVLGVPSYEHLLVVILISFQIRWYL